MKYVLLDHIILNCKLHLKEDRSIAAIYYLLIGEKAIQTVQDAHVYGIQQYYGIYKNLSKYKFDKKVKSLVNRHLLVENQKLENLEYHLTDKGKLWLTNHRENEQLAYFKGLHYERISTNFLNRLLLLIQVLTNSKMKYTSYIPIIDHQETMNWMKMTYKKMKININKQLILLNTELYHLLKQFPKQEAEIFVDRLTGYKTFGLSIDQLSLKYKVNHHTIRLLLTGMSHRMLDLIKKDEKKFPFCISIIGDLKDNNRIKLTQSAQVTNNLINNDKTIEAISQIRNLKINTIYDHIVEIAIYDRNFPIDQYVSEKDKEEIIKVLRQNKTFKLKKIKANVHENISYFQIRLVLAMINNVFENR